MKSVCAVVHAVLRLVMSVFASVFNVFQAVAIKVHLFWISVPNVVKKVTSALNSVLTLLTTVVADVFRVFHAFVKFVEMAFLIPSTYPFTSLTPLSNSNFTLPMVD